MNIVTTIALRTIGVVYWTGVALLASRGVVELKHRYDMRKRKRTAPHVDTIEDQLDIQIHATEITERYPFTRIKEDQS